MAMDSASSLPTARFLHDDYDGDMNVTCNLSNCTTPNSLCVYYSCLYFPLPPPPPPTLSSHKSNRFFPNYFLITAASLLALFSFLLLLLFCRRRRLRLRGAHLNRLPGIDPPPHPRGSGVSDGDDDGGGGIHHVWLIRTVGLDDSVIRAIPAVIYKAGDGIVDDGKDCAVCLGEFADGETIKLLPKCSHAFHPNCIDTWLKSHVNCPLCRAPVTLESTQIGTEHQNQEEHAVGIDLTPGTSSSSSTELQPIRRSVSMDSLSVRRELELKLVENAKSRGGKRDDVLRKLGVEMKRSLSSRSGRLFFPRHKHGRHGRSASVLPL